MRNWRPWVIAAAAVLAMAVVAALLATHRHAARRAALPVGIRDATSPQPLTPINPPAASQSEPPAPPVAAPPPRDDLPGLFASWSTKARAIARKQIAAAAGLLERITDGIDHSPLYHRLLGQASLRANRIADAEQAFKRACELAPDMAACYSGLALVMVRKEEWGRSEELLLKAIDLDPWNVEALYNLAVLRMRLDQLAEAEALCRRVLTTQPDHLEARANLAALARRHGRLGEARMLWEQVIETDPSLTSIRFQLGTVYYDLSRYDEAMAQFKAVVEREPRNAECWSNIGLIHEAKGNDVEALRQYQRAYELAAENKLTAADAPIVNNLADFHLTLHRRSSGDAEHLKQAMMLWQQSLTIALQQTGAKRLKDLLGYYRELGSSQPDVLRP